MLEYDEAEAPSGNQRQPYKAQLHPRGKGGDRPAWSRPDVNQTQSRGSERKGGHKGEWQSNREKKKNFPWWNRGRGKGRGR